MTRPKILLADEPTGNLDPELSRDIMKLFEQFNQVGTTVIVASHDRDLIESMGVRIIELDQGMIVRDGVDTRIAESADTRATGGRRMAEAQPEAARRASDPWPPVRPANRCLVARSRADRPGDRALHQRPARHQPAGMAARRHRAGAARQGSI